MLWITFAWDFSATVEVRRAQACPVVLMIFLILFHLLWHLAGVDGVTATLVLTRQVCNFLPWVYSLYILMFSFLFWFYSVYVTVCLADTQHTNNAASERSSRKHTKHSTK